MSEPPSGDLSFDPKTWRPAKSPAVGSEDVGRSPALAQAEPSAEASPGSYDPETRSAAGADAVAPRPGPTMARRAAPVIIALFALAAVAGSILVVAVPRGPVARSARTPAPEAANARRVLVVSDPAGIRGALDSAGVLPAEAAPVAAAAIARMAPGSGDITVAMSVAPAAGGMRLLALDARHADGSGVVVKPAGGGFAATTAAADLHTQVKVVRGEMDAYSFYSSAVSQHLTDSLISPFAQALAFDFDFQREISQGDVFEAAFEDRVNSRGESVDVGHLLYVSMQTKDKSRALYWFQPPQGEPGWFDANGRSTVRSLMRTPVEGARISSTFGMREHPILGFTKMHNGIDFAAPVGTPVYAAGDGVVQHAEFKDLDGNHVEILHPNGWRSIYLHLSAFAPGVVVGAHVRQGQEIGQVGTTGRSTGPHLHYEVHVADVPVDPASLKLDSGKALEGTALAAFIKERDRIDTARAAQTG
jgi:murein DD-endopeptidase MepM/ murein hydrolase activator NlpD